MFIYIPSKRFIDTELPTMNVKVGGRFTMQAVRGSFVKRELSFNNLITDYGLNIIGGNPVTSAYDSCQVGLGNTAPSTSDTTLATYLGGFGYEVGTPVVSHGGSPDYWGAGTIGYLSSIGALGNNNLTEIGVSGQTTTGNLFSRALIVDGLGVPTSFPISSSEQLRAYYELRCYPPLVDTVGSGSIGASSYDITYRASNVNNRFAPPVQFSGGADFFTETNNSAQQAFSGDLAPITSSSPTGILGQSTSIVTAPYVDSSLYRDYTITFGTGTGNGNIRTITIVLGATFAFQVQFDPVIVKNNTQVLTLNFRLAWDRYP